MIGSVGRALRSGVRDSTAMDVISGIRTYSNEREEGGSVAESMLTTLAERAAARIAPHAYMAYKAASFAARTVPVVLENAAMYNRKLQRMNRNLPFQSAVFVDSQQAAAMRQAGVMLARQANRRTQEAVFGNEAKRMSRGWR